MGRTGKTHAHLRAAGNKSYQRDAAPVDLYSVVPAPPPTMKGQRLKDWNHICESLLTMRLLTKQTMLSVELAVYALEVARDVVSRKKEKATLKLQALPFPGRPEDEEHYAELRKITSIGVQYFIDEMPNRVATLTMDTLNELYSQLLWSLTRAELFFRPVRCECGRDVPIDIRFHGQNFDAEPF